MRIAHIQYSFAKENGGPTRSLSNYCRGQIAAGHEVSIWTLEGFPQWSAAVRLPPPIEMNVFQVAWPSKLGRSPEMRRQLRQAKSPDIFHLHGIWLQAMRYGAIEARRRKIPYMVEMAGMYEPWGLQNKWFSKRIARWWYQDRVLHEAECLHVNSPQEARHLRELGFKNPIAVIPVGVDLQKTETLKAEILAANYKESEIRNQKSNGSVSEFQLSAFENSSSSAVRGPWSAVSSPSDCSKILRDQRFVLYLSRLHPKKGLDLLIRSWAALQKAENGKLKSENWTMVIAGSGESSYIEECQQLAKGLGIANQCLWLGHVDDAQKSWLYTNTHCYVLPTSSENFGNTVAEALAHGAPVITTHNTPWQSLEQYGCGWLADNTEKEICQALQKAMSLDATVHRRMKDAAESLARDRYSLRAVLSDINAVYEWLCAGGSIPACVQLDSGSMRGLTSRHGSAAVPAAGSSGVSPLARRLGETPGRLAGEDACATSSGAAVPPCVQFERTSTFSADHIGETIEVERLFDQKAATWSKKYEVNGSLRTRLFAFEERLGEVVKRPAKVLDFGCGTGNIACHLSARGYAVSACDISPQMIAWARKINGTSVGWEVIPVDRVEMPYAAESFDAVVASSVFEYLTDVETSLTEIWRMLKPGGFLVFTVPNSRHRTRKMEALLRPIAMTVHKMPLIKRVQKLSAYATYLRCSRNRMPLDDWFAMGERNHFTVIDRGKSQVSKTPLIFLIFRKTE